MEKKMFNKKIALAMVVFSIATSLVSANDFTNNEKNPSLKKNINTKKLPKINPKPTTK